MSNETISIQQFKKTIVNLCVRNNLEQFPKKTNDKNVLLKSIMLSLEEGEEYSQSDLNIRLKSWIENITKESSLDHSSLRRFLVDAGYLSRSEGGQSYKAISPDSMHGVFDAAIEDIDVFEMVRDARDEIERKKQEFMNKRK